MKRFIKNIIVVLVCTLTFSVNAASFNTKLSGTIEFEDTTSLTVSINNASGFEETSCAGICKFEADLNYDSSKVSVSVSGLSGFSASGTNHIVATKTTGVTSGNVVKISIT